MMKIITAAHENRLVIGNRQDSEAMRIASDKTGYKIAFASFVKDDSHVEFSTFFNGYTKERVNMRLYLKKGDIIAIRRENEVPTETHYEDGTIKYEAISHDVQNLGASGYKGDCVWERSLLDKIPY